MCRDLVQCIDHGALTALIQAGCIYVLFFGKTMECNSAKWQDRNRDQEESEDVTLKVKSLMKRSGGNMNYNHWGQGSGLLSETKNMHDCA